MSRVLLMIDYQNDFCHPQGALYVPGADKDALRASEFLRCHHKEFDEIFISMDWHQPMSIERPAWWVYPDGRDVEAFTSVSYVLGFGLVDQNGAEITTRDPSKYTTTSEYIQSIASRGISHTIWPSHCVQGTWGADLAVDIPDGVPVRIHRKGMNPYREEFSCFGDEISAPSIHDYIMSSEEVVVTGEASSHCVRRSVEDLIRAGYRGRITVLRDLMSPVTGFEHQATEFFDFVKQSGHHVVDLPDFVSFRPRLDLAVDVVAFTVHESRLKTLLIQRKHSPFQGKWAIPGGFVEHNEPLDEAAYREFEEETSIPPKFFMEQLYTFGDPNRDPRGRVVSAVYLATIPQTWMELGMAGSDAASLQWFDVEDLPEMAFDHAEIMRVALERLRGKIDYSSIAFGFLPHVFTSAELRHIHSVVKGRDYSISTFRRKFKRMVEDGTILLQKGVAPGNTKPSKLYRFKPYTS
jgi:8-oxo-dGTP diphosphatase